MKHHREITIYDIAKTLNISPSTVSRALKGHPHIRKETIDRIKAAAEKMGYQRNKFASNLRERRTNTLGLIVPRLNSYFMSTAIAGIEKVTNENGYELIISTSQESMNREVHSVKTLFNNRVDGLMVSLAYDTDSTDHFNIFFNKNIPVIFFDRVASCPGCISVVIDNNAAGFEVTKHLIGQGCRRIAHIGGNHLRNVYSQRYEGYRNALADAGISFNSKYVINGDLSRQHGIDAAEKILAMKPRPDGIFAANDASAISVIMELQKKGIRIPEDICVAGFNNEPVGEIIKPNLTSVEYPADEIGEIVARLMIERLKNRQRHGANTIILNHKLIVRESSTRVTSPDTSSEIIEKSATWQR